MEFEPPSNDGTPLSPAIPESTSNSDDKNFVFNNSLERGQIRSRKRTKHGRYISEISLEEVQQYTHLPANMACQQLGMGLSSFKRLCRSLGIQAWPYRKVDLPGAESATHLHTVHGLENYGKSPPVVPQSHMGCQNTNIKWDMNAPVVKPDLGNQQARASALAMLAECGALDVIHDPNLDRSDRYENQYLRHIENTNGAEDGGESLLQRLFNDATPGSIITLLEQVKSLSVEMKATLGVSIIDDAAVDLIIAACMRIKGGLEDQHNIMTTLLNTIHNRNPPLNNGTNFIENTTATTNYRLNNFENRTSGHIPITDDQQPNSAAALLAILASAGGHPSR